MRRDDLLTIFKFITGDFEATWKAITKGGGGCNYLLGLHAMIFLEWIMNICKLDNTGKAHKKFFEELKMLDQRYFVRLPAPYRSKPPSFFPSPISGMPKAQVFLVMLFDLVRNGTAHSYDQVAFLADGKHLLAKMLGARPHQSLDNLEAKYRTRHLTTESDGDGLVTTIHSGLLYLDLKKAFNDAHLSSLLPGIESGRKKKKDPYLLTTSQLKGVLPTV
jgi:hypothetical protein